MFNFNRIEKKGTSQGVWNGSINSVLLQLVMKMLDSLHINGLLLWAIICSVNDWWMNRKRTLGHLYIPFLLNQLICKIISHKIRGKWSEKSWRATVRILRKGYVVRNVLTRHFFSTLNNQKHNMLAIVSFHSNYKYLISEIQLTVSPTVNPSISLSTSNYSKLRWNLWWMVMLLVVRCRKSVWENVGTIRTLRNSGKLTV